MASIIRVIAICLLASCPLLADLSEVGPITLGNSWTQAFIVNNSGTNQSWDRVEFYMYSPPGFESIGPLSDASWSAQSVGWGFVLATGPLRTTDLVLALTFNDKPGPMQFVALQYQGGTLLRGETTLVTYNGGWSFQAAPDFGVAAPETGTLVLVGGSLVLFGLLIEKKSLRRFMH